MMVGNIGLQEFVNPDCVKYINVELLEHNKVEYFFEMKANLMTFRSNSLLLCYWGHIAYSLSLSFLIYIMEMLTFTSYG